MQIPANVGVLSEQSLPIAGNPHLLIGQNLEESSCTEGFVLGCKKIISSSVASGAAVALSLAAKWSKVNSSATATSHVWLLSQELPCPSSKIWAVWQRCQWENCLLSFPKNQGAAAEWSGHMEETFCTALLRNTDELSLFCWRQGKGKERSAAEVYFLHNQNYNLLEPKEQTRRPQYQKNSAGSTLLPSLLQQKAPFSK